MPELVNGLGGQQGYGAGSLPTNGPANHGTDDESTGPIDITPIFQNGLNYFGQIYTSLFVNNNGNVTFGQASDQYTPSRLNGDYDGVPIIAPFFADVDTRSPLSGVTTYGTGTVDGHDAFIATWPGVGYYDSEANKLNSFQLILTDRSDRGVGDFDITFNYAQIQWESGSASDGVNGLGGDSAVAGYSNGSQDRGTFYELPGSGHDGALLDSGEHALTKNSNVNVAGQYVFAVKNGVVVETTPSPPPPSPLSNPESPSSPPPPPVNPHELTPVFFGIGRMGIAREGDTGATPYTFVVTRAGQDLSVASSVDWTVRIADTADFAPGQALAGSVAFAPGQTQATVTVLVQGDKTFEPDEMFEFKLTTAHHGGMTFNADASTLAVILNDDLPNTFKFGEPLTVREGMAGETPFVFDLTRAGDLSKAVTVQWKLDLGDADALDFAPGQALTGTVTFAAGASTTKITLNVAGDTTVEKDEVFKLDIVEARIDDTAARLMGVGTTGTILDDDGRKTLLVASNSNLVKAEGDAGQTAFSFDITRVGDLTKAATVAYAIKLPAGGLGAGEIAGPLTGEVTFGAGVADAKITVLVNADTVAEANESFLVNLGGSNGFSAVTLTGVVLNDDGAVGGAAPQTTPSAPSDGSDTSGFMQHLMGGSLWGSDGGI